MAENLRTGSVNDYGANYFINLIAIIAPLYFHKLGSFFNFLKLQVSETCSQLLMRLRRKSVRASSNLLDRSKNPSKSAT